MDLVLAVRRSGWREGLKHLPPWILGIAILPLVWQIIDIVAQSNHVVMFRSEVNILLVSNGHVVFKGAQEGGSEWYLVQALFQLHGGSGSVLQFNPLPYLQWFTLREGWAVSLLLLLGLVITLRVRMFPWVLPAALVFIPYLVYMFAPFIVPRNLDAALPFACLLAAASLVTIVERLNSYPVQRTVLVAMACIIAASGAFASYQLTGERSGFAEAASFVQHHGGRALISNEVLVFYLPGNGARCEAPPVPGEPRRLAAERLAGYRYAVLDHYASPVEKLIETKARVVVSYPAYGNISIGENPIASENSHSPSPGHLHELVTVYKLWTIHLPRPGSYKPTPCNRDIPA